MPLDDPLVTVVGPKTAKVLDSGLGLRTAGDLLRHYPRRYVQRGDLTDLGSLRPGEYVTVFARVAKVNLRRMADRKRTILEVQVTDGTATLELAWFNQAWRSEQLVPGVSGLFAGKVGVYRGKWQLAHPEYELSEDLGVDELASFASALIPVYPATVPMPTWKIRKAVDLVLGSYLPDVVDPLPAALQARLDLIDARTAVEGIHRPRNREALLAARRRLRFDEAFVLQLELARRRLDTAALPAVARPGIAGGLLAALDDRLPFTLTAGQCAVGAQIERDLAGTAPMHRLLQGEVGSGKTLVALRAMLTTVDAGGQAVLLAPTEVLAGQHHRTVLDLLGPLALAGQLGAADQATRVVLLTGSLGAAARRDALAAAADGTAGIVVGTHALLEEHVTFDDLGLVVVDEQHRFGVEQRAALGEKGRDGARPHVLVMTATPIPRTVAMTVFGDLETSTLTEVPAGRADVVTHVVDATDRPAFLERAWARVREEVAAGRQAYVVCVRIGDGVDDGDGSDLVAPEEDETLAGLGARERPRPVAVEQLAAFLAEGPLAGLRLAVLHGRLDADEKDEVMRRLAAGTVDVLVATTVVEVGVDVPNASVMVVMDAERFGVSQLHQLRGRIGRGAHPGLCLLVTTTEPDSPGRQRLEAVAATRDGFVLARVDLQHRREGDILGATQSGRRSSLRLLSVLRDQDVIETARTEAIALVEADPDLDGHPELRAAVAELLDPQRADYLEKA